LTHAVPADRFGDRLVLLGQGSERPYRPSR
jgi:hypothetical protein